MGRVFKIVVTGPFNSGKTTFIGAISEIEVVSTERAVSRGAGKKPMTTVAMDFGRISLPDGYVIHMYGTPGQERFDFMREILAEGMLGYVVLLDGSEPSTFEEGKRIMEAFERMSDGPFVVAVTRADRKGCLAPERVRKMMSLGGDVEVASCDARGITGVKSVLISLLELVMERAEAVEEAG